jgi:hypothetical protein
VPCCWILHEHEHSPQRKLNPSLNSPGTEENQQIPIECCINNWGWAQLTKFQVWFHRHATWLASAQISHLMILVA